MLWLVACGAIRSTHLAKLKFMALSNLVIKSNVRGKFNGSRTKSIIKNPKQHTLIWIDITSFPAYDFAIVITLTEKSFRFNQFNHAKRHSAIIQFFDRLDKV